MDYKILINKEYGLNSNFVPPNLIIINNEYKEGIQINKEVYYYWLGLKNEALANNYEIEIESGYRSYDYQFKIMEKLISEKGEEYAKQAVAKPGHSEHQTGLAIDYCVKRNKKYIIEQELDLLPEVKFINVIVYKYGFIIRYPKGKEHITGYMYEPWHLRYVGVDLATYLYKNNLTLDEYYQKKLNNKYD